MIKKNEDQSLLYTPLEIKLRTNLFPLAYFFLFVNNQEQLLY